MSFQLPRFYPLLDHALLAGKGIDPVAFARLLAESGAKIAQFRHKGPYTRADVETAERIGAVLHEAGALFVINDRADIAVAAGADGVHLGQDDLPPGAVRGMVGERLFIGLSTHNEDQLRSADREPADYLALGPIFGTRTKENPAPKVGVKELARLRALTRKPLAAIGGITRENAAAVFAAGADSAAVISDLIADDSAEAIQRWAELSR